MTISSHVLTRRATNLLPLRGSMWKGIVIFTVALTLRLIHIWQIRRSPFFTVLLGDARRYDAWAQRIAAGDWIGRDVRSEEHTSELQSRGHLVCRLLLEKKKNTTT